MTIFVYITIIILIYYFKYNDTFKHLKHINYVIACPADILYTLGHCLTTVNILSPNSTDLLGNLATGTLSPRTSTPRRVSPRDTCMPRVETNPKNHRRVDNLLRNHCWQLERREITWTWIPREASVCTNQTASTTNPRWKERGSVDRNAPSPQRKWYTLDDALHHPLEATPPCKSLPGTTWRGIVAWTLPVKISYIPREENAAKSAEVRIKIPR